MAVDVVLWCVLVLLVTAPAAVAGARRSSTHDLRLRDRAHRLDHCARRWRAGSRDRHEPWRRRCSCRSACPGWARISGSTRWQRRFSLSSTSAARRQACTGSGYGRHEPEPGRVLPFFPAFLAGMNLVVLADDAFTFLLTWEFMSLTSWALVMAHHRQPGNARAGYIYLLDGERRYAVAAPELWSPGGSSRRLRVRRDTQYPAVHLRCLGGSRLGVARRRLQGRARATPRLAAARASGRAEPRVRAHERCHDQGRGVRLRSHRLRPDGTAHLVVGWRRAPLRRRQRGPGRPARADGARSQASARVSHGREHRHHFHRARSWTGIRGQRHARGRRRWRRPRRCFMSSITRCSRACSSSVRARFSRRPASATWSAWVA